VPFSQLGVATSNLTFFRQIGGSVGLAIVGTMFSEGLVDEIPKQVAPVAGQVFAATPVEQQPALGQFFQGFATAGIDLDDQTGVGQSFGETIVSVAPPDLAPLFQPFVTAFDTAFGNAMSIAIANTFWLAVVATLLGLGAALFMRELPLRSTDGSAEAPADESARRSDAVNRPALPATD
jgi:spore maturation protein SpmA